MITFDHYTNNIMKMARWFADCDNSNITVDHIKLATETIEHEDLLYWDQTIGNPRNEHRYN